MLPEVEAVVLDSEKIDALTLTSKSVVGRALLSAVYHRFGEEAEELAFQKPWKSLGYTGYRCRSVRWGSRLDGSVLFSSGSDAMKITAMLVDDFDYLELRTTRVDLCIDVALSSPKRGWLRSMREEGTFKEVNDEAGRQTKIIESDTGDTLYIGSRESGRFGRIYDKSLKYGLELGYVYRFELETKKQVAPAVFKRLFPENEDALFSWDNFSERCRGILQSQFKQWGVGLNLSVKDVEQIRAEVRLSTADSQLEWLARSVAPVLEKLSRAGYQQQMFAALGYPVVEIGE